MTSPNSQQIAGSISLLRDGLDLMSGDTLLLLYQRELTDAATCIREQAEILGVEVDYRELQREEFVGDYPQALSIERLSTQVPKPTGIVLLIEWSEETTKARLALVNALESEHQPWRIASMPGVDLDGLASCVSDFPKITDNSRAAFAILARSNLALLQTNNPDGKTDTLTIPVGEYSPIISTGQIPVGRWGNFPSGETFVVPNPFQAKGWVTVRGSIPSHPLNESEWIRLQIRNGRIRYNSITASSKELQREFVNLFFSSKRTPKCQNASSLAELGIGTNPGINRLIGKPIFDEKKIGTVHIAFGENKQFWGPLTSCLHHDIICTDVTLKLRNKLTFRNWRDYTLVNGNQFCFNEALATPDLESFVAVKSLRTKIVIGEIAWEYHPCSNQEAEKLIIEYSSPRGILKYQIASGSVAQTANDLLKAVKAIGGSSAISIKDLKLTHPDFGKCEQLGSILAGLLEYRLLKRV